MRCQRPARACSAALLPAQVLGSRARLPAGRPHSGLHFHRPVTPAAATMQRCARRLLQLARLQTQSQQLRQLLPTAARDFTSLPVIDVGPLVGQPGDVDEVAAQLHAACRDVGFFVVKNHGVPADVTEGVLRQAHEWFALPEPAKRELLLSPGSAYRGYQPLGSNVTRHEGGFTRDHHEALDFFRDVHAHQASRLPPSPLHGPNPWPDRQLPAFGAALRAYVGAAQGLGDALLRGIARGLGLPDGFFGGSLAGRDASYWVLRVIHYPPLPPRDPRQAAAAARGEVGRDVQLSCGEHTDYGLLTLVNQDSHVSALQVKNADGHWVDAPPIPGTFVVNIGDMMQVLTNGLYTPTLHRVLNTSAGQAGRVSAPFFHEPAFDALVAPAPQLCGGRPPAFKAVHYGRHLESKVLTNFELEQPQQAAAA